MSTPPHSASSPQSASPPETAADWDARYAAEQVWSGEPNGALVAEAVDLGPGRALDVGCGEGADALWLAQHGWEVTALDLSRVALERAQGAASAAGAHVAFQHSGLLDARLPDRGFDLVAVMYPALRRTPGADAERALLAAVAPGGTLLVVHHAHADGAWAFAHGVDLDDWVGSADVAALLGEEWAIEVNERRERTISGGAGAHHSQDLVLRARRLP